MNCWHCKGDLIWGGDHTYEDCGHEGEGIISNLSCPNKECGVEYVEVHYRIEDADNNQGKTEATQKA